MKHRFTIIIVALVVIGIASATHANATTITYNFQENGSNLSLGPTSTFTEGGFSLTASGFLTSGGTTNLYAKSMGGDEIGLGTTSDPSGQHEIVTTNFVQLTVPTTPASTFDMVLTGSVQTGEQALVYFTTTPGTLAGATLIGSMSDTDGSILIPAQDQNGFIDITAGSANVLLESAQISTTTTTVPEPSSLAFLALGAGGILALRRRRKAASK